MLKFEHGSMQLCPPSCKGSLALRVGKEALKKNKPYVPKAAHFGVHELGP